MRKFKFEGKRQAADGTCIAQGVAAVLMVLLLAACSVATETMSSLPKKMGGMSEDVPARPTTQLDYPAVHDMPPPRTRAVLTDDELKQAEAEMAAARDGKAKTAETPARAKQ
jgi:hypothetical protein